VPIQVTESNYDPPAKLRGGVQFPLSGRDSAASVFPRRARGQVAAFHIAGPNQLQHRRRMGRFPSTLAEPVKKRKNTPRPGRGETLGRPQAAPAPAECGHDPPSPSAMFAPHAFETPLTTVAAQVGQSHCAVQAARGSRCLRSSSRRVTPIPGTVHLPNQRTTRLAVGLRPISSAYCTAVTYPRASRPAPAMPLHRPGRFRAIPIFFPSPVMTLSPPGTNQRPRSYSPPMADRNPPSTTHCSADPISRPGRLSP